MREVREDKMPLDDAGLYKEMNLATKAALLKYGAAFESVIDAARIGKPRTRDGTGSVGDVNDSPQREDYP